MPGIISSKISRHGPLFDCKIILLITYRKMKKNEVIRLVVVIGAMIVIATLTYFVGHNRGERYCAQHLQQPPEYWEQLVQLDRDFLSTVVTRSNRLASGTYVFEIRFPGQSTQTYVVALVFANGRLLKAPNPRKDKFVTHSLVQNAHVVSWSQTDTDEGPNATYVGLIDGLMMWGKVYVPRGTGWHQNPPAIGVWRLYPEDYEQKESASSF